MTDVVEEQWTAVEKLLVCDDSMKKHLRTRFDEMLASFLEEHPDPDRDELESFIGTPEDMAVELMEYVSVSDVETCRRKRRIVRILILVFVFIVAISMASFYFLTYVQTPIETEDAITVSVDKPIADDT